VKEDLHINMDNFHIEIVARGQEVMARGLEIAFAAHGGKADGWGVVGVDPPSDEKKDRYDNRAPSLLGVVNVPHYVLTFYSSRPETRFDYNSFPVPVDAKDAAKVAFDWLKQKGEYGDQPDHDGDNERGFYLFCNTWGHVLGSHYGIVGVGPAWAMLGK
jgi:hypothetical protein